MSSKKKLREEIRGRLEVQGADERRRKSQVISEKLFNLEEFKKASCVCFYVSMPQEVDTSFMIDQALAAGKKVVAPYCHAKSVELSLHEIQNRQALQKSSFGILEPIPDQDTLISPEAVDCVVVPGVVFDKHRYRLGQGKGFYDRFLKKLKPEATKIGLAFSFQVVEEVPVDEHDVRMDLVLTDLRSEE